VEVGRARTRAAGVGFRRTVVRLGPRARPGHDLVGIPFATTLMRRRDSSLRDESGHSNCAAGASTWCVRRCARGLGTSAPSRSRKASGSKTLALAQHVLARCRGRARCADLGALHRERQAVREQQAQPARARQVSQRRSVAVARGDQHRQEQTAERQDRDARRAGEACEECARRHTRVAPMCPGRTRNASRGLQDTRAPRRR